MINFISKIGITIGIGIASIFGWHQPAPVQQAPTAGAIVPITTDFYTDSLQAGINQTATSFTLVKGSDGQGNNLNGTYGFTIDQGSPSQEVVYCNTVSGVNVSGCSRGIDLTTGTSTVVSLEKVHNRGATVQITTAPVVNILTNTIRGIESIHNILFYDNNQVFSSSTQLVDKNYVDNIVISGAPNSSEGVNGISQLATAAQAALGTSFGSTGARLVLPSSLATSTFSNSTVLGDILSLNSNGKISPTFLNGTDLYTFNNVTTLNGFTAIASSTFVATTSIAASSVTNRALVLNSVPYQFPATQGAANTAFVNNGSGILSSLPIAKEQYTFSSTTSSGTIASGVTYTLVGPNIPAGTLTASSTVTVEGTYKCSSGGSIANACTISVIDGDGNTYVSYTDNAATLSQNGIYTFTSVVSANNATNAQRSIMTGFLAGSSSGGVGIITAGANTSVDWTATKTFSVKLSVVTGSGNTGILEPLSIVINP